jgi:hypothetical protein
VPSEKITVIPPWAHSAVVHYDPDGRQAFRERYGFAGKYVVMYSGNHSPCHPLTTVLQAAARLAGRSDIAFCFVGGGSEFPTVVNFAATHNLANIRCLPYQPLADLSASLSAADLHVVIMGDPLVGIVHTCKIYNIMCIGAPVLYIGPSPSHVMDIAAGNGIPLASANHGDVDLVVRRILANAKDGAQLGVPDRRMVERGRSFHQDQLVPRFADLVETLSEETPAAVAPLPNASNGSVPKALAASAGGAERNYSSGD